jgi:hypothetical protein
MALVVAQVEPRNAPVNVAQQPVSTDWSLSPNALLSASLVRRGFLSHAAALLAF